MAVKKKKKLLDVVQKESTMEIHLIGDILPNSVFQQIIELMKANRESEHPKSVRFFVSSSMMLVSVRYAIPSQFYESVEIEGAVGKEVLKDAAGM